MTGQDRTNVQKGGLPAWRWMGGPPIHPYPEMFDDDRPQVLGTRLKSISRTGVRTDGSAAFHRERGRVHYPPLLFIFHPSRRCVYTIPFVHFHIQRHQHHVACTSSPTSPSPPRVNPRSEVNSNRDRWIEPELQPTRRLPAKILMHDGRASHRAAPRRGFQGGA